MELSNAQISLTYQLGGEYLIKRGIYRPAVVSRVKGEYVIDKNLATLVSPKYADAHQVVNLPQAFVDMCLERPKPPKNKEDLHRWMRTPIGKIYVEFKKLSEKALIQRHIEIYVKDITGLDEPEFSYEIF